MTQLRHDEPSYVDEIHWQVRQLDAVEPFQVHLTLLMERQRRRVHRQVFHVERSADFFQDIVGHRSNAEPFIELRPLKCPYDALPTGRSQGDGPAVESAGLGLRLPLSRTRVQLQLPLVALGLRTLYCGVHMWRT